MPTRTKVAALTLSAAALVGIATHEGYFGGAYRDIVGVWTIGFGSTDNVKAGDKTDPVRALRRAVTELEQMEGQIKKCVFVDLTQYEYDAYLSLSYNIGTGAFCRSTLVRKLNAKDYKGACKEILRWNKAGGREVRGLTLRRQDEYKKCMGEV